MTEEKDSESLGGPEYEDILISVANPENARQLVRLAQLISTRRTTFHIMNVTIDKPFPERGRSWRQGSELVTDTTHFARRLGRTTKPLAATSSSVPGSIVNAAEEVEANLIIMGWFGRITPVAVRRSSVVNKVLHKAPCDVAVLKARKSLQELGQVVMPVGPSNPREKRLAIVRSLLKRSQTKGELIHVLTPDREGEAEEQASVHLEEASELLGVPVETRIIEADSVLRGLIKGCREADLVVVGPGREWVFDRFLFGRTADNLTNQVDSSVLMFKGSEHKMVAWTRGLIKTLFDMLKRPF